MKAINRRVRQFTPEGMLDMLIDSSNEEDGTSWHDLFYDGHKPTSMCEPLSNLAKYMAEKSLSKDIIGQPTKSGTHPISYISWYSTSL